MLGFDVKSIPQAPSSSYLILLAHSKDISLEPSRLLSLIFPILMASIQANSSLDECLSLLLQTLHRTHLELSAELIIPLAALLPSLASGHPDPTVRYQTFRVLSLLLSLTPSSLRLQILKELTSDSNLPQMRSAAVGLVKEAVLEAIPPKTPKHNNVFATPLFLQVLGPIVLRPDPLDFFSSTLSAHGLEDSFEAARITECLAFYYTLLLRDKDNLVQLVLLEIFLYLTLHLQTGIRDQDSIGSVESMLLGPMRTALKVWLDNSNVDAGKVLWSRYCPSPVLLKKNSDHLHAMMPLVALKTGLERVDGIISELNVSK